jgi:hypothetical protein
MAGTVADQMVDTLHAAGVRRVWAIVEETYPEQLFRECSVSVIVIPGDVALRNAADAPGPMATSNLLR